jgi:hypothetical protein
MYGCRACACEVSGTMGGQRAHVTRRKKWQWHTLFSCNQQQLTRMLVARQHFGSIPPITLILKVPD